MFAFRYTHNQTNLQPLQYIETLHIGLAVVEFQQASIKFVPADESMSNNLRSNNLSIN